MFASLKVCLEAKGYGRELLQPLSEEVEVERVEVVVEGEEEEVVEVEEGVEEVVVEDERIQQSPSAGKNGSPRVQI